MANRFIRVIRMAIYLSINKIDELKRLPDSLKVQIINEYNKGYHFLLFYGKILVVIVMILSLEFMDCAINRIPWIYKVLIYAAFGYLIAFMIKIIEVNIIAKKVIRDLAKDAKKH